MTEQSHSLALPEVHIMSSPNLGHAVFHPPTFTLFRVNECTASVLEGCLQRMPASAVAEQHGLSVGEVESLVTRVNQIIDTRPPVQMAGEMRGVLQKLAINVSNDCNMRCRYCYADGGSYGQSRELMTVETARQTIDRVFGRYRVSFLMFFGGEPTLNPDAIQACCDRLLELHGQGTVPEVPGWGMVTNGLVLTRRMQEIIERHDLVITVSLDGPPEINDRLRITRNGKGSFDRIARNIHRIQEITNGREPSKIEAVYTPVHKESSLGMTDLIDYLDREFGINDIHVAPVVVEQGHPLHWRSQARETEMFGETSVHLIESWLTEHPKLMSSIFQSVPAIVARLGSRFLCGAGLTILAVSASGDIYPCYILLKDKFRMGNVADLQVFESERFRAIQQRFREIAKDNLKKCNRCWARGFCHVCFGVIHTETQTIDQVPDHVCLMNQSSAESALLALSRIQTKPDLWKLLCSNVAEMINEYHGGKTVAKVKVAEEVGVESLA